MDNKQLNQTILDLKEQIDSFESQFNVLSEQINENEKRCSTIINGMKLSL